MITEIFRKNFSRIRKESGISQLSLSRLVGVTETQISRWENGKAFPSAKYIDRLAEVLKVEPTEFFTQ